MPITATMAGALIEPAEGRQPWGLPFRPPVQLGGTCGSMGTMLPNSANGPSVSLRDGTPAHARRAGPAARSTHFLKRTVCRRC